MSNEHALNRLFGTLRSLLQHPEWTDSHRCEFLHILGEGARLDHAHCKERWAPYLDAFPHHFDESLDELWMWSDPVNAIHGVLPEDAHFTYWCNPEDTHFKHLEELLDTPCMMRISELSINRWHLSPDFLHTLSHSPHHTKLRGLYLAENDLTHASIIALSQGAMLSGLTTLHIQDNHFSDVCMLQLLRAPFITQLNSLVIESEAITRVGWSALVNEPRLRYGIRQATTALHLQARPRLEQPEPHQTSRVIVNGEES